MTRIGEYVSGTRSLVIAVGIKDVGEDGNDWGSVGV